MTSISRRDFLLSASSAALLGVSKYGSCAEAATQHGGKILLGLTSPVYFNGFSPFLNWWKTASAPTLTLASGRTVSGQEIWDLGGYLDPATGDIVSPAPAELSSISRVFYKSANKMQVAAGCDYAGEEWTATWDGSARGRIEFANEGGKQKNVGPNQIDFTTGVDPDKVSLLLELTNREDPPRRVRIFQIRYHDDILKGKKFNPDWLAEIGRFGVLRFMGWMPTNNETIAEFSQLADENYFAWGQQFVSAGRNGEFGPKGSMHPQLICDLANLTGCDIHVCIPVRASDDFVRKFAEFIRDNTNVEVTYELSNECWNPGFEQFHYCRKEGAKIWQDDILDFAKWYGYRSAECMSIVREVYNDRARWRGALATQTVDVRKTLSALAGVDYWRKKKLRPVNSLTAADLFKSLYVTGYFGFRVLGQKIANITNAYLPTCTAKGHGFKDGQKIKLFVTDGPTRLNDRYCLLINCTEDTFQLAGVSTIGMGTYLPPCRLATSMPLPQSPVYDNAKNGAAASLKARHVGRLLIGEIEAIEQDIILVKDQSDAEHNGIYKVIVAGGETENWRLDRVGYFSDPSTMIAGSSVRVDHGAAIGTYILIASVRASGGDAVVFKMVESNNYAVDANFFELMDASTEKHSKQPGAFPTKFSHFNEQVAQALRFGYCDSSLTVAENVSALEKSSWPAQLSIARAYGLTLRQYEGGCDLAGGGVGLLGNPYDIVYGGNARFGEFIFDFGHSEQAAQVYEQSYAAFWRVGGEYPSKFVADGRSSNAGTWAGVRFWPLKANSGVSDASNPVWKAVSKSNARGPV